MHYERGGRCQPRRQISLTKNLGAPERAPRPIVVEHMQTIARPKSGLCRTFSKPSSGLEPETPSLPWNFSGNRWQPVATDFACFCGLCGPAICNRLPPVATTGLHKGSILCCRLWPRRCCSPRSSRALSSGPGSQRQADLPLVAEWVDDPAEPPAVLVAHPGRFPRAGGHRLPDDPLRVVD